MKNFITFLYFLLPIIVFANTYSTDVDRSPVKAFSLADNASVSITGNLTIEFWVKPQACVGTDNAIIYKAGSYVVNTKGGSPTCDVDEEFNVQIGTTNVIKTFNWYNNDWHHYRVVYTAAAGTADVYQDGVLQFQNTGYPTSIPDNGNSLCINQDGVSCTAGDSLNGLLDDMRLWSTLHTADDWCTELVGNEANLNAYWRFENNALDETANNNDLTEINSPTYGTDVHATCGGAAAAGINEIMIISE